MCYSVTCGWAVMMVSHIWRVTGTVYCYGNLRTAKSPCFFGAVNCFLFWVVYLRMLYVYYLCSMHNRWMNIHIEHWWDDKTEENPSALKVCLSAGHLVHNIYQWTALDLCGDNLTTKHLRDSSSMYVFFPPLVVVMVLLETTLLN
jgi:hypothetical protein